MVTEPPAPAARSGDSRLDEMIDRVREAWAAALDSADFGDDDDFFAAGGHSLLVAGIVARLSKQLHRRLSLRVMFDNPTVSKLAAALAADDTLAASRGR